jgi:hypothetical protein
VEFHPGVFLTAKQLEAIKQSLAVQETGGLKVVVRNLLLALFTREELARSCCKGQRGKDDSRSALPEVAVQACKSKSQCSFCS